MGNPLGGLFGGGGKSSSSSNAQNSTTVNVEVPITVDTAGVQAAIEALAGSSAAGSAAVAGALVASSAQTTAALQGLGAAWKETVAAISGGDRRTQIIIAVIGFVGVLLAARVIRIKKGKVKL